MAQYNLIVSKHLNKIHLVLLDNFSLVEYHIERLENSFSVGDIFLGKVKKIMPGLNAAFVDIGHAKDAFLHFHDLGSKIYSLNQFVKKTLSGQLQTYDFSQLEPEKETSKDDKISEVLKENQKILIQIIKEPISSKGSRLSCEISLAGRFIVLLPFSETISISKLIPENKEKKRLKNILREFIPKGFGVIIRTVAKDQVKENLQEDLSNLIKKWENIHKNLKQAKSPFKVFTETTKVKMILRDIFNQDFQSIVVDDEKIYQEVLEYIQQIAPEKESILKLYKHSLPLFEKYKVFEQIKSSFGRTVPMKQGTYLVIEHTEALHVIDVNSGNQLIKNEAKSESVLEINLIAAMEIARQLRLRDMGGIIVVDFIDMPLAEHRRQLFEYLQKVMSPDKAKHKILPPSKFGLIQITRQRVRPEMNLKIMEKDPNGKNELIPPPIQIINEIYCKLEFLHSKYPKIKFYLNTHPFVHAYLQKKWGFYFQLKWFLKYKRWISIYPFHSHTFLQYSFTDKNNKVYFDSEKQSA